MTDDLGDRLDEDHDEYADVVFSSRYSGGDIVTERPRPSPGAWAVLAVVTVVGVVSWFGVTSVFLDFTRGEFPDDEADLPGWVPDTVEFLAGALGWWPVVFAVVGVLSMLVAWAAVPDVVGRQSAEASWSMGIFALGAGAGAVRVFGSAGPSAGGTAAWVLSAVGVALVIPGVVMAVRTALKVRGAMREQARLRGLREHGTVTSGVLSSITFQKKWAEDKPLFAVEVGYRTPTGTHRVDAHLVTPSGKVPVVTSPLRVTSHPNGRPDDIIVELDDSRPIRFDSRGDYRAPSSDGGGSM